MQKELQKTQTELENKTYEGSSSLVNVVVNGKKELVSIKINSEDSIEKDELELLEDMILIAVNDALKKAEEEKNKKLSKYGQGLTGLM
jgi:DNA-binding YbaB/EbfC family protein